VLGGRLHHSQVHAGGQSQARASGQLASVTTGSTTSALGYDPLGRLISAAVGGVTTTFAYQGSQLTSQSTSGGTSATFLNSPYGTVSTTSTSRIL
jgi:YD repeat-containing protein